MQHDVQADVAAELDWDPKVDSSDISVAADAGAVILTGTVDSLRHLRQARHAACRVCGVTSVRCHLTVRAAPLGRPQDASVEAAVRLALKLDTSVPPTIKADVVKGTVRLTGTATWHHQRSDAELICSGVGGVIDIVDQVVLIPVQAAEDIQHRLMSAYRRNARLTTRDLSVDVLAGAVILSGTVHSSGEHDDAVAAAWCAPGVTSVDDRVVVIC